MTTENASLIPRKFSLVEQGENSLEIRSIELEEGRHLRLMQINKVGFLDFDNRPKEMQALLPQLKQEFAKAGTPLEFDHTIFYDQSTDELFTVSEKTLMIYTCGKFKRLITSLLLQEEAAELEIKSNWKLVELLQLFIKLSRQTRANAGRTYIRDPQKVEKVLVDGENPTFISYRSK